jgi:hypothetical protein
MPAEFEHIRKKKGAKIRTVTGPDKHYGLKKGEYRHIAFYKGESVLGEKKRKKDVAEVG